MRRLTIGVIFLLCVGIIATGSRSDAQGSDKCDLGAVFKRANGLKATGDQKKDSTALADLQVAITNMNIICNGATFTGKGPRVIGPFDLRAGIYKAAVVTKGSFLAGIETIGDCGASYENPTMFLSARDGNRGEDIVKAKQDCRIAIEVSFGASPWTLTLEPIE